ncbi:MAG: family 43 glycosylhydrolase [Clostridia bacterium]|nr:family 43 glycosylhydrolase [Clostridia bacterium]
MRQMMNPYLPLGVYIPDGEPHVFEGRVYIYGSHDASKATVYCPGNYNVWSAPTGDLTSWRDEGTSYLRRQDPTNADDRMQLWAPDAARGADGRYYLYYCFPFYPEIGVAVADRPGGPYEFYAHVHYPDGRTLKEDMPFDPAVLVDDDGRVYLYYGFCPAEEKEMKLPEFTDEMIAKMSEDERRMVEGLRNIRFGENSMVVELEEDMATVKSGPKALIPGGHHTAGTGFEGHGFFEASSIRKFNGMYYFVYSSHKSHELCYAISEKPDEGFRYGGIIISNGNIGYRGRTKPCYTLSNNHGGIEKIGNQYYIFYHRGTDGSEYSRQGCAEPIEIRPDGRIDQVEMTSCGLNGGPLPAKGIYPAAVCCHMTCPRTMEHIDYQDPVNQEITRITEDRNEMFVTDIQDGTVLGYKYFDFQAPACLMLELRGAFEGKVTVSVDEEGAEILGTMELSADSDIWEVRNVALTEFRDTAALFLTFSGRGTLELKSLGFIG